MSEVTEDQVTGGPDGIDPLVRIDSLTRRIQASPDKMGLRFRLANVLEEVGRHDEADRVLSETVERYPRNNVANTRLGAFRARRSLAASSIAPAGPPAAASVAPGIVPVIGALATGIPVGDVPVAAGRSAPALLTPNADIAPPPSIVMPDAPAPRMTPSVQTPWPATPLPATPLPATPLNYPATGQPVEQAADARAAGGLPAVANDMSPPAQPAARPDVPPRRVAASEVPTPLVPAPSTASSADLPRFAPFVGRAPMAPFSQSATGPAPHARDSQPAQTSVTLERRFAAQDELEKLARGASDAPPRPRPGPAAPVRRVAVTPRSVPALRQRLKLMRLRYRAEIYFAVGIIAPILVLGLITWSTSRSGLLLDRVAPTPIMLARRQPSIAAPSPAAQSAVTLPEVTVPRPADETRYATLSAPPPIDETPVSSPPAAEAGLPPNAPPNTPGPALPPLSDSAALAEVALVYPAGDQGAARQAAGLVARLQQAGIAAQPAVRTGSASGVPGIAFYFAEDAKLAQSVAGLLGPALGPVHQLPVSADAVPGTIQITLPSPAKILPKGRSNSGAAAAFSRKPR